MFGVSGPELLVILLVGLIVLGPDRLPVVARKAGQMFGEIKRVSSGFEAEVRTALFEAEDPERYRPRTPESSVVDPPGTDPEPPQADVDPAVPDDGFDQSVESVDPTS